MDKKMLSGSDPRVCRWLQSMGLDISQASRVVIDIPCDGPLVVSIERPGTEQLLSLKAIPEDLGTQAEIIEA